MKRCEDNKALMEKLPRIYSGKPEQMDLRIKMDILATLQDISVSLAQIADALYPDKKPCVSCDTCKHDVRDKVDFASFCNECYDFSEWEAAKYVNE